MSSFLFLAYSEDDKSVVLVSFGVAGGTRSENRWSLSGTSESNEGILLRCGFLAAPL
jgi:hypothetical protein